jgi:arylsulfatase
LCSPTRQALKTGRNHHSAAMGKITELATSFPGYTGVLPDDVASIGKMLNYNGFSTAAFGKWHETAVWEISPSGPMTRWPNHQGFEEFYGFMGGETNQWTPTIYHNQNRVETPEDPTYHFLTDMRRTRPGSITSPTWSTCATGSACEDTARRTRSRSTRKRATTSSST